jgi:phosphatidylglycerophosphatase A
MNEVPMNKKSSPAYWIAVWFGAGLLPVAPGTWGSLVGAIMGWGLLTYFSLTGLVVGIIWVTIMGAWAANEHQKLTNSHDAGEIVIDEVAGQWIAMIPLSFMALTANFALDIAVTFILFRLFDIIKPWPIRVLDKHLTTGWGVMLDDVAAGLFAAITFILIVRLS